MTIKNQLAIILKQAAWTQEKLARELNCSFATVNSWINGRSHPRPLSIEKIEELYKKFTGEKTLSQKELKAKYDGLLLKKHTIKNNFDLLMKRPDLYETFILSLTYNSNKIEGSTLTEDETASILFDNKALLHKTLTEQLEAKNHQTALEHLFRNLKAQKITEEWILKLHGILMNGIRHDAGCYRNHGVRIVGSFVPTANPLKIPQLMKDLVEWINKKEKNPVHHATVVHARFEKIHPFSDGNGRIGRLLMLAMLLKRNFPPAVIRQEKKRLYYTYLSKAQLEEDYSLLEDFIMDAIDESLEWML
ncbi:Fic family protein [Candidatus Peregrinibacteria bacterium]|nr:MAG: Fic family protein [Candidatus Peregrinibacteria bacterium]